MIFKAISMIDSQGSCFVCIDRGSSERLAMQNIQIPDSAKLGLYQSGSFHPASQTIVGSPPAVRMLSFPRQHRPKDLSIF